MDIRDFYDAVIFTSAALSIKDAVVEAVKQSKSLQGAICGALICGALICGALICGALICRALICRALICRALICRALICRALICGALICRALICRALICRALICRALICGALICRALICRALICRGMGALNAETALAMIQFLPETGSFEGWKKCSGGIIVKLLIPEDAKRSHGSERKARASKATVLEIFGAEEARSGGGYETVIYRKGETVQPDGWDEDRWNVCSHGIHFFLTRIEAENYQL